MIRNHSLFEITAEYEYHPRIQDNQDSSHTDTSTRVIGYKLYHVIARRESVAREWVEDRYKNVALPNTLVIKLVRTIAVDAFIEEHTY